MGLFYFILGLVLGSFLNVVLYRLPQRQSFLKGRSKCPYCHHSLAWYDLVPLFSFFYLRGKCRYCGKKISWLYPAVELVSSILMLLAWLVFVRGGRLVEMGLTDWQMVIYMGGMVVLLWFLLFIFIYDWQHYLILDEISIPAMIVAIGWQLSIDWSWSHLLNILLAALVVGGFFLAQFLLSQGRWIGGGDVRLGFLMGFILGWPGALVALFLAYIIGAVVSLLMVAMGKKQWGGKVPFGTFLTLATVISLFWGDKIIGWYL